MQKYTMLIITNFDMKLFYVPPEQNLYPMNTKLFLINILLNRDNDPECHANNNINNYFNLHKKKQYVNCICVQEHSNN